MEYQTFRGSDVKEALSAVKAALGPNAMIGSTRFVTSDRTGGLTQPYVEVLAREPERTHRGPFAKAAHWDAASPQLKLRGAKGRSKALPRAEASRIEEPPNASSEATGGQKLVRFEQQLMALKAMIEELHATRPPKEQAQAMLAGLGIEGALARELASGAGRAKKRTTDALREWLKGQIAERFAVEPGLINGPDKQLVAAVGPTGVGKTTTLAKLAARARLDLGKSVSVISLDTFRVGAQEQWQRYANLMGLALFVVQSREGFQSALDKCNSDLMLIDTPGHVGKAHKDWLVAECLDSARDRQLDTLLVLPAWLRSLDVEQVTHDYDVVHPTGLVTTKVDEAHRVGGMLHAAAARDLPFAYLCNGPRVPEDITDATHETLISAIFQYTT